jgi:hypothetical protein
MARGRIIDKEIHSDVELAELPIQARYLFKAMIIHADDDGRMMAESRYLCAKIFPMDPPISAGGVLLSDEVARWRDALGAKGLITLYTKGQKTYLAHKNWQRWQPLRKDRLKPSDIPSPTDDGCHLVDIRLTSGCQSAPEPNPTEPNPTELNPTQPESKYHSGAEKKTPGDGRISLLIREFHTRLETKLGEKPASFNGGAAGRAFIRMLKTHTPEEITARMTSWFDSSDPFIVKNGWRVEMFLMNFNALKGGPIAETHRAGGGYIGAPPVANKYAALTNRPKHS